MGINMKKINNITILLLFLLIALTLSACQESPSPVVVETIIVEPTVEVVLPTETPLPEPTVTQEPAAVLVNGEAITVSFLQAGIARYELAQSEVGAFLSTENVQTVVMDELISQVLFAQKAREAGFVLTEEVLDQRILTVIESAGGQDNFNAWLSGNYFTPNSFRSALRVEIEGAWMRDQIIASIPTTTEQVLAREIFFLDELDAIRVYNQLVDGSTFDSRVVNYDPQELGYLGWFPKGVLFDKVLEDAIFALQPGQYTIVIETENGFHVAELIEREESREVSHDLMILLQEKALEDWLAENLKLSTINILI